ncbi:hypothetical protein C0991_000394 [Blastosporella zonata]|nr:hypothetical protein C0991_000394 [Blastosporella zonata]
MTNSNAKPVRVVLHVPNPGSGAKDPNSKEYLRATLSNYKRRLQEELSTPSDVAHVSPPWTNDSKHWTMEEKMTWWKNQPEPQVNQSSVAAEFEKWLKDVYRKHIPESEERDVFFDAREQEALAEAGW